MKTAYEIKMATREIHADKKDRIGEGCTLTCEQDISDQIIESCDSKEKALKALENYKSSVVYYENAVPFYYVTEYYIEENTYDDDGEWESCEGVWKFAPFRKA